LLTLQIYIWRKKAWKHLTRITMKKLLTNYKTASNESHIDNESVIQ
jgi:uncharacterized protein (DUF2062 family)